MLPVCKTHSSHCGTIDGAGNWLNCYMADAAPVPVCSGIVETKCQKSKGVWCGGSRPKEIMDKSEIRAFKFVNNTKKPIVILSSIGDEGYYKGEENIPHWNWLRQTDAPAVDEWRIVGDPSGLGAPPNTLKGWTKFIIRSLGAGDSIITLFPLIDPNFSDNLRDKYSGGISGINFSAIPNENFPDQTELVKLKQFLGKATDDTLRSEITLQNDMRNIVKDSFNLSAIPQGCGAHMNTKATLYQGTDNINSGTTCLQNKFAYNIFNPKFYSGSLDSDVWADDNHPQSPGPSYVCGFPQTFSENVLEYCGLSDKTLPGSKWASPRFSSKTKKKVTDCGIDSSYQCMLKQRYDNYIKDPTNVNNTPPTKPLGINYDIDIRSGQTSLKKVFAPNGGGYDLQKDWKISEYMDAKEWDGYGYPYQEELDEHVLDEKKLSKLAGGQDVYYIGDIVKQNKISDGQIVSKPIGNILPVGSQVKLKDIYIYEIHYYDLGHSF